MNLTICIGYDSKEPLTWQVLAHSIIRRASKPVTILPIALNHLRGIYTRTDPGGTTEFSLSRFLTPYLCGYKGWGLFMDSDMLCLADIHELVSGALWPYSDANQECVGHAVGPMGECPMCDSVMPVMWVCQHDYAPKADTLKATGVQTAYPRKNWSSLMLFDCLKATALTPEYVNAATPAQLHRFEWAGERIVALPLEWNWLVGEYDDNPSAKVLHYTLGAPCFPGYEDSPMADLWWTEYRSMMKPLKTYSMAEAEMYAKASGAVR